MYDRERVHLKWLFFLSWSLLVSILSSQADPPTLTNLEFALAAARFLKNQGFGFKMLFRVFWGSLGLLFGAPGSFSGALLVLLGRLDGSPNV